MMDAACDTLRSPVADPNNLIGMIVAELCAGPNARTAGWQVETPADSARGWIKVAHQLAASRNQGWKLHISAGGSSVADVLRRALPVLLAEPLSFKVAAAIEMLDWLNEGAAGLSQIGKFITVYPKDDDQAVRLAGALHRATQGLRGPAIPSDRPLLTGSLIHYRYGGFSDLEVQTPIGQILPAIAAPDGTLVPDRRLPFFAAPDWAVSPFGVAESAAAPVDNQLIAGRYLPLTTLNRSARGTIVLAVDIQAGRRCILKRARRDAMLRPDGRDARDRLRNEADVLTDLAPDRRFPTVFDLFEHAGDLLLALEDIEGITLEQQIIGRYLQGQLLPPQQALAWARNLAATLAAMHARGIVYRDLKSTNIIIDPAGNLRLIDFESAYRLDGATPPFWLSTAGYCSPQQQAHEPPAVADDIYSFGALLYYLATSAEPYVAPRPFALLNRPPALLNPAMPAGLTEVITRCLMPEPAQRFPSMDSICAALGAINPTQRAGARQLVGAAADRQRCYTMARRLTDSICAVARPAPDGQPGLAWASTHPIGAGLRSRDINTGGAGTLLALAELSDALDHPRHQEVLAAGARWLMRAPRPRGHLTPGLYIGEAGLGAALLRAGQVLGDDTLIDEAARRGRWIATLPYASPDLFHGTAGRLRFHLFLWDETNDREHLGHALAAGEVLLAGAEDAEGGLRWIIPLGYDKLSGNAYLGYAHGAAGIADALLDLFDASGDERFLRAARGAGHWLARLAVAALEGGDGLTWPMVEGADLFGPFWCHGAAGIGRFFMGAAARGALPEAAEIASRAARTVARGARWAGPTQCHGLAGNIEFLLDMAQATGEASYLHDAWALAPLLWAFASERDDLLMFSSENPHVFSPDYMVGYAGIATCLLRLSDPERLPHLISRAGFRSRRLMV